MKGDHAYIADYDRGLHVIDVSDPSSPQRVGSLPIAGDARGAAAAGGYAYIVNASSLHVLPVQCYPGQSAPDATAPASVLPPSTHPNPSRGETRICFETYTGGRTHAGIYDPSGRSMCRLFDGFLGAGSHALPWDGCDAQGRPAAAGIYLVRVSTQAGSRATSLAVLR